MTTSSQTLPVRLYQSADRIMLAAPMPGLEPENISARVDGLRVTIHGEQRGPRQHDLELLLAEWTFGPYSREVTLVSPVNGALTNATYDNGVLVLSMPKARPGEPAEPADIRLERLASTRGERVGHAGREIQATTTGEHRRGKHDHLVGGAARAAGA
jgi:HSP20 family protein